MTRVKWCLEGRREGKGYKKRNYIRGERRGAESLKGIRTMSVNDLTHCYNSGNDVVQ